MSMLPQYQSFLILLQILRRMKSGELPPLKLTPHLARIVFYTTVKPTQECVSRYVMFVALLAFAGHIQRCILMIIYLNGKGITSCHRKDCAANINSG
jgi:hypothetical protein